MSSNLFAASVNYSQRSAAEVKADQDKARAADQNKTAAARAAGRGRRSI